MNNAVQIANVGSIIRIILSLLAGATLLGHYIPADQIDVLAGAFATVIVTVWAVWKNYNNHNKTAAKVETAATLVSQGQKSVPEVVAAAKAGKL